MYIYTAALKQIKFPDFNFSNMQTTKMIFKITYQCIQEKGYIYFQDIDHTLVLVLLVSNRRCQYYCSFDTLIHLDDNCMLEEKVI